MAPYRSLLKRFGFGFALLLAALCTVSTASRVLQQQAGTLPTSESPDIRLSLAGTQNSAFLFQLLDKRTGQQFPITVSNRTRHIKEIHIVNPNRGLIVGEITSGVQIGTLLDFQARSSIDEFLLDRPSLSPDRRYLAYVKFFPRRTQGVSNQYLVYDFAAIPRQNRVSETLSPGDLENVGIPLFPLNSLNIAGDNIGLPPSQVHSWASPSFFWVGGVNVVAFADRSAEGLRLVVADLRRGMGNRAVFTAAIDGSSLLVNERRCRSFTTAGNELTVWKVTPSTRGSGILSIELRSGPEVCGTFDIPIPMFEL